MEYSYFYLQTILQDLLQYYVHEIRCEVSSLIQQEMAIMLQPYLVVLHEIRCEVSSLTQQEMALMLRPSLFLANETRFSLSGYYFSLKFCIGINFLKITYHQGELQSTFIEFSHDF